MAISPPSDIISDVVRAADPARYQAAAQKLAAGASPADGAAFDAALSSVAGGRPLAGGGFDIYEARNAIKNSSTDAASLKAKHAYQDFEAFVLQSFVESMLPKDEGTFGKGSAGSVWRSMMAEQIAAQVSKAGGIGIAKYLAADRNLASPAAKAGSASGRS